MSNRAAAVPNPADGPASELASEPPQPKSQALWWMLLLTFLWGTNAVTIKVVTAALPPIFAAGLRGAIALGPLTLYGWWRGESLRYRGMLGVHAAVTGIFFALEFVLFYSGATRTQAGHIAVFLATAPLYVAMGAHFVLPEDRLTPAKALGLIVALGGIATLFSDDLLVQKQGLWRGDLMVMASATMWGTSTLYTKRFLAPYMSSFRMLYIKIVVSTVLLLGLSGVLETGQLDHATPLVLGLVAHQGLVIVFFSYLMWMVMLRRNSASSVQSYTFLTPVWGVLGGLVLLDEVFTPLMALGIALVGAGLTLINRPARALRPRPA